MGRQVANDPHLERRVRGAASGDPERDRPRSGERVDDDPVERLVAGPGSEARPVGDHLARGGPELPGGEQQRLAALDRAQLAAVRAAGAERGEVAAAEDEGSRSDQRCRTCRLQ